MCPLAFNGTPSDQQDVALLYIFPLPLLSSFSNLETITEMIPLQWAHVINISILFDCPPNKSHCSNKHSALPHWLPLFGRELLMPRQTIYYRHLSQVTDKLCDGCMIWRCQNGFISWLPETISSELMRCAYPGQTSPQCSSFSDGSTGTVNPHRQGFFNIGLL